MGVDIVYCYLSLTDTIGVDVRGLQTMWCNAAFTYATRVRTYPAIYTVGWRVMVMLACAVAAERSTVRVGWWD